MSEFTRDQALADLQANPAGSVRSWAKRWSWTTPRVHRFLRSLERAGHLEVLRSKAGTTVTPVTRVTVQNRPQRLNEVGVTAVTPRHLDTRSLYLSRCEEDRFTERLIEAMNVTLSGIFESGYQRVSLDNFGSHRAGKAFLAAGIPFAFARDRVVEDCRRFNPSKHGNGQLPKSLGIFTRGILRAWNRRAQLELGIPPQLKVDRAPPADHSSTRRRNEAELAGSPPPELLGALMGAFVEGQLSRRRL